MNRTLDHRLLRWIVHRPLELVAGLYVLAVFWGGLVPFDFQAPHVADSARGLLGLPTDQLHLPDMIANLAVFLPVGLLVRALLVRNRWGAMTSLLGAMIAGCALSLMVESAQLYSAHRTSSAVDLLWNLAGTWLGALFHTVVSVWMDTSDLGLRASLRSWAERVRARPGALLAQAAALVIALAVLTPFDVVVSLDRLAASVRDATWFPFARTARTGQAVWSASGTGAQFWKGASTDFWQLRLDYAWTVVAYAVLAMLIYRYLARHCRMPVASRSLMAVTACFMLVTALSVAQLAIMSRSTDVTCVLLALVGAIGGVLVADATLRAWSPETTSGALFAPVRRSRLVSWSLAVLVLYVAARELVPFEFDASPNAIAAQVKAIEWLPMRMYQNARLPIAVDDLVHKTMQWASVAMLVCLYRRHRGRPDHRQPIIATALGAAAAVALLETLQLLLPARSPAITDVLIAAVAAAAGVMIFRLAAAGAIAIGLIRPVEAERIIYNIEFGPAHAGPHESVPRKSAPSPLRTPPV